MPAETASPPYIAPPMPADVDPALADDWREFSRRGNFTSEDVRLQALVDLMTQIERVVALRRQVAKEGRWQVHGRWLFTRDQRSLTPTALELLRVESAAKMLAVRLGVSHFVDVDDAHRTTLDAQPKPS